VQAIKRFEELVLAQYAVGELLDHLFARLGSEHERAIVALFCDDVGAGDLRPGHGHLRRCLLHRWNCGTGARGPPVCEQVTSGKPAGRAGLPQVRDYGGMPLTLVTGPANAGKARWVLDEVRARLDDGPVLVVPSAADVGRYRRELAAGGAVFGATVVAFDWLARDIAGRVGYRKRVVDVVQRRRIVEVAVGRVRPGALAGAAATPGFAAAADGLIAELERSLITPQRFAAALRSWGEADPARANYAADVASLYLAYRGLLDELGIVDRELFAWRALDALRASPERWGRSPVLFYGFDDLTALQRDAVDTLLRVPGLAVTVALSHEPGRAAFAARAGTVNELEPLAERHVKLPARPDHYAPGSRDALHRLERGLFEEDGPGGGAADEGGATDVRADEGRASDAGGATDDAGTLDPGDALGLLEGGGERAEIELVAAEALALLERGVPPGEVVVVHRAPGDRAELIEDVFALYGVPVAVGAPRPLASTAIGRALLGLLRAALLDGEAADVLAWLRAPGVAEPRLADAVERDLRRGGRPGAEAALEALRRRGFGVEEVERLRAAAVPADEGTPAGPSSASSGGVGNGAPAGLSSAPDQPLRPAVDAGSTALLRALAAAAERLLGAPHRREAKVLGAAERREAAAAVAVRRALDGLAELAALDPALAPDPATLERTLAGIEVRVPAPPAGSAVEVRHPLSIRARRVRALIVCGLQEGVFPRTPRPDPFLGDEERAAIARASGLRLDRSQESVEGERYLFYACASRAEERLVLAWRTGDDEGAPAVPSLFLEDVRDVFDRAALEAVTRRRGLGDLTWPPDEAPTARERALAQAARAPGAAPRAVAAITAVEVLDELRERRAWSAAQIEAYAGCPVKWLVEHYLRPEELEPASEPLLRGGVAHGALEDTLSGLRERTGSARVTAASVELARDLLGEALERREKAAPLSIHPARRRVLRRRLEADLLGYLGDLAGHEGPFEPREFELRFGAEGGDEPGAFALAPDLGLVGRIDRVDVRPGGREAVLVDYKGSTAAAQAKWIPERRLQLGLYMLAAREVLGLDPVAGLYQPLAGERRARGLVLRGAGAEDGTTATDLVDRERFEEVLDEVRAIALRAAGELRSGRLEPRPDRCHWKGGGCAYPSICRCESA